VPIYAPTAIPAKVEIAQLRTRVASAARTNREVASAGVANESVSVVDVDPTSGISPPFALACRIESNGVPTQASVRRVIFLRVVLLGGGVHFRWLAAVSAEIVIAAVRVAAIVATTSGETRSTNVAKEVNARPYHVVPCDRLVHVDALVAIWALFGYSHRRWRSLNRLLGLRGPRWVLRRLANGSFLESFVLKLELSDALFKLPNQLQKREIASVPGNFLTLERLLTNAANELDLHTFIIPVNEEGLH